MALVVRAQNQNLPNQNFANGSGTPFPIVTVPASYFANGGYIRLGNASLTNGQPTITCPSNDCAGATAGQIVYCTNAGTGTGYGVGSPILLGLILSSSAGSITSSTNATASTTTGGCAWGQDVGPAAQAASVTAFQNNRPCGTVQLPAGVAFTSQGFANTGNCSVNSKWRPRLLGCGRSCSIIIPLPLASQITATGVPNFNFATCGTADSTYPACFTVNNNNGSGGMTANYYAGSEVDDLMIWGLGNTMNGKTECVNHSIMGGGGNFLMTFERVNLWGWGSNCGSSILAMYGLDLGGNSPGQNGEGSNAINVSIDDVGTAPLVLSGVHVQITDSFVGDIEGANNNVVTVTGNAIAASFGTGYGTNACVTGPCYIISVGAGGRFTSHGDYNTQFNPAGSWLLNNAGGFVELVGDSFDHERYTGGINQTTAGSTTIIRDSFLAVDGGTAHDINCTAGTIAAYDSNFSTTNGNAVQIGSGCTFYTHANIGTGAATANLVIAAGGIAYQLDAGTGNGLGLDSWANGISNSGTYHHTEFGTCAFAAATTCPITFGVPFGAAPTPTGLAPENSGSTIFSVNPISSTGMTLVGSASNSNSVGWSVNY